MPILSVSEIDLFDHLRGPVRARQAAAAALIEGLSEAGVVAIRGHGVPAATLAEAHLVCQRLFALSQADKQRCRRGPRGYAPLPPTPDGPTVPGECWRIGHDGPFALPNAWPPALPEVRVALSRLFDRLFELGGVLLDILGTELGVPEGWFQPHLVNGTSVLRAVHYPPLPASGASLADRAVRGPDLLTLTPAGLGTGVQLLDRDGASVPFETDEDVILVQAGQLLERWTNGVIPATTDAVVPSPASRHRSRYALPLQLRPRRGTLLSCLPHCRDHQPPPPPITVGELLDAVEAPAGAEARLARPRSPRAPARTGSGIR